ncbi:hypothetical protein ACT185_004704 [Escherichia coli]
MSFVPSNATPLILRAADSLFAATAVPFDGRAFAALFTVSRKPRLLIKVPLSGISAPFWSLRR